MQPTTVHLFCAAETRGHRKSCKRAKSKRIHSLKGKLVSERHSFKASLSGTFCTQRNTSKWLQNKSAFSFCARKREGRVYVLSQISLCHQFFSFICGSSVQPGGERSLNVISITRGQQNSSKIICLTGATFKAVTQLQRQIERH